MAAITRTIVYLLTVVMAVVYCQSACSDATFDAVTSIGMTTYAFKGSKFYTLVKHGQPTAHEISRSFPGLPSHIDAAVYWPRSSGKVARTYFFKAAMYYRFEGNKLASGYPKNISCGFPGVPNNFTAAFIYNFKTYFVKDDVYYAYTRETGKASAGVHRSNSDLFRGAPKNPSAVAYISTKRHYYYFSGNVFYKMHSGSMKASSHYPKKTADYWFSC